MSLLSIQFQGLWWCLLLALVCTIAVHGVKLAVLGLRSLRKKAPPPPEPEKPPEPVYYLVERKKKRVKTEYDAPRKINFQ